MAHSLVAGAYLDPKVPILHLLTKDPSPLDQISQVVPPTKPRRDRARLIRGPVVPRYFRQIDVVPLVVNVDPDDVPTLIRSSDLLRRLLDRLLGLRAAALRSIGESVPLDISPSEVPDSDDSNKAEIDPASPDHPTTPPDGPSESDALEDIFYLQREKNDRKLG